MIDIVNEKISWKIISDEKLGIEPDLPKPIEEGNLKISSRSLGQGYEIELYIDYKGDIDVESSLKLLSGKYNLVIEHIYDTKDHVNIRESG